jgi:hypothetical protein
MPTLEARLGNLERKLRFYQIGLTVIILTGVLLVITAFNKKTPVTDLIQAKEFQVVDDYGKVYASMKQHDGYCDFKIYNGQGTQIIRLTESSNGYGAVMTSDKSGTAAVNIMGVSGMEGGSINVFNKYGKTIDEIGVTNKNTGYLGLYNSNGNDLFKVTYTEENNGGWLGLYNATNKNMITLSNTNDNDGVISVYNRANNRVCVLGGDNSGNGVLNVLNSAGLNMNGVWPK